MYGIVGISVPECFVFSSKDPTCCDLLRAFAHIAQQETTMLAQQCKLRIVASVCTGLYLSAWKVYKNSQRGNILGANVLNYLLLMAKNLFPGVEGKKKSQSKV